MKKALFPLFICLFVAISSGCLLFKDVDQFLVEPDASVEVGVDAGNEDDANPEMDMSEDAFADLERGSDASEDGGGSQDDGGVYSPKCDCGDGIECVAGRCQMPNSCNINTVCPDRFDCIDFVEGLCECNDNTVCGQLCDTSDDCVNTDGFGSVCIEGRCNVLAEKCISQADAICPDDTVCNLVTPLGVTCGSPGSVPSGGDCSNSRDCQSMHCELGVCIDACRRNSDCRDPDDGENRLHCGRRNRAPACIAIANGCGEDQFAREKVDPNDEDEIEVCITPCSNRSQCEGQQICRFDAEYEFSVCTTQQQDACSIPVLPGVPAPTGKYHDVDGECISVGRICVTNADCDEEFEVCNASANTRGHCRLK